MPTENDNIVESLIEQLSVPSVESRREASDKLFRLGKKATRLSPPLFALQGTTMTPYALAQPPL